MKYQIQPYDWSIQYGGLYDYDEIHCWSMDRSNKPFLIRIQNYYNSCYVAVPPQFLSNPSKKEAFFNAIKKAILPKDDGNMEEEEVVPQKLLLKSKLVKKPCLYHSEPKTFIWLALRNKAALDRLAKACNKGLWISGKQTKIEICEHDITIIRKFLTEKKCTFCQWLEVEGTITPEEKAISTVSEIETNFDNVNGLDPSLTTCWVTNPWLFSFDIECHSSNYRKIPNKTNSTDVITMISCNFMQTGRPETLQRHMIVVKACNPIKDATVYVVKNEIECIDKLFELIKILDPEILMGYNIMNFDIPYIDMRWKRRLRDQWSACSRLKGERPFVKNDSWYSEAYGYQNNFLIVNMGGRITIDVLALIKRDYKLRKYTLDFVSNYFIGESKHDIKAQEMFAIYDRLKAAKTEEELEKATEETTRVAAYCIQDADLVLKLFEELKVWVASVEMSNIVGISISDLYTRGQQVRCKSQIYDLAYHMGYVININGQSLPYKGALVREPNVGIYKNCSCLDFASLYPSIIAAYNICYTTLVPEKLYSEVPDEDCHCYEFEEEFEKGKLEKKDEDETGGLIGKDLVVEEAEEGKKKKKKVKEMIKVHYKFKFYKKHIKEGLLPQLVTKLTNSRKAVKKLMNEERSKNGETLLYNILNKRQLALKISNNSLYGFMGVSYKKALLPLIQGAVLTTYLGRQLITEVNEFVQTKFGYEIIYNDTDSAYIDPHIDDEKEAYRIGKMLETEVNKLFEDRKPIKMEFEKASKLICLLAKKKYFYVEMDENGNMEYDKKGKLILETKGIIMSRRDNCKWLTDTYGAVMESIAEEKSIIHSADIILKSVENLLNNKVELKNLAMNKSINSNYKSKTAIMKVFGDELRSLGQNVEAGTRIDFVVVKKDNEKKVGKRMRLYELYLEDNKNEPIDITYYLEKVLANPINQLFGCSYNKFFDLHPELVYEHRRRKDCSYKDIVKVIINGLNEGMTIKDLRKMIMGDLVKAVKN
jgi:DNA polymerase delta subunit 1